MKRIKNTIFAVILTVSVCAGMLGCAEPVNPIAEYTVEIVASQGGTVTASATKILEGADVTFSVSPTKGHYAEAIVLNGNPIALSGTTYTVRGVTCDLSASAVFATPDAVLRFDAGEDALAIADRPVSRGGLYGTLPMAVRKGKKFLGWTDKDGKRVSEATTVSGSGTITLTAVWEDITDAEKLALVPFAATTTYHDAAATKYGVVWHSEIMPFAPAAQVVEKTQEEADFSGAKIFEAESEKWLNEFISTTVIDGLSFDTEYCVRFGDRAADVWSEVYTFRTRTQQIDVANFIYLTDTQETYRIANQPDSIRIGSTYYNRVMQDAAARFPDAQFVANGGDIVNYGAESSYWAEMLGSVEEYLFSLPTMVTAGNHEDPDYYSAGKQTVNKLFNIDYPEGGSTAAGVYYSFDYGPVHFVSMRSNDVFRNNGEIGSQQLNWLKADFAAANQNPEIKWTIVMMHEGFFVPTFVSSGPNYHTTELCAQLLPVFDEYDIDLVLYGHNHYLSSTYPVIYDPTVTERLNGITNVGIVTSETESVLYDGVNIDDFVFGESVTDRGTVFHQAGTAGSQFNTMYKLADLAANKLAKKHYRMLLSGGAGCIEPEISYSMYSYIEAAEDTLVVRTYGVNVKAQDVSVDLANGRYLDGFRLKK